MRLCYDIETDGLDPTVIWCIVAQDVDTKSVYKFSDHDKSLPGISDGVEMLRKAEVLIGHNVIGYDSPVIHKLCGVDLLDEVKHYDTWIMSMTLRYRREHRQGLAGWGEKLGNSKIEYDDWTNYNKDMLRYCVQDVKVNVDVFFELMKEFAAIAAKYPMIKEGLKVEHDTAIFNVRCRTRGWNFNVPLAEKNLKKMMTRMNAIERIIEPKLGERKVYKDKTPKTPKYNKNGNYNTVTARLLSEYFGKNVDVTDTHMMPPGTEYQRYSIEQVTLGQIDLVKAWLYKIGWKPDEFTKKKTDSGQWINVSPKLTETSLAKLGDMGEMVSEYYTLRNRTAVIRGWLEAQSGGRLHGNMWTIGTPTFRARHEVIVNLPGVDSAWGRELRELFESEEGNNIVGCDSSGNQLRGLCHYVGNDEFTHEVCFGDQHQRNADILGCSRPVAKGFLYAYLFGAGAGKLGQVLTGKTNPTVGKKASDDFGKGIKGLGELRDKITETWNETFHNQGAGWFPGLDGRPVFAASEHQCLNYLLQSAEGITCKAAISYQMEHIKKEGLRAEPRIFYHDESAWDVHPEDAERVGEILKDSFREGPKMFNVQCMDGGDYVIGSSYADVH